MSKKCVTIALLNIGKGAVDGEIGAQRDRLPKVIECMQIAAPDVIVLNETKYFSDSGHKRQAYFARAGCGTDASRALAIR